MVDNVLNFAKNGIKSFYFEKTNFNKIYKYLKI